MFYKHNDSVKRRMVLGIGEALLATCAFGCLGSGINLDAHFI